MRQGYLISNIYPIPVFLSLFVFVSIRNFWEVSGTGVVVWVVIFLIWLLVVYMVVVFGVGGCLYLGFYL